VIKADEKARYDESFDQLGPTDDDIITGKKARKVLMKTGLSQDVLGKIWELADIDSDGNLDRDEFAVAMHLIRSCMSGKDAPDTLPADLMPPSKRGGAGVRAASPPAEAVVPPTKATPSAKPARASAATSAESHDWVVTAKELKTYDDFFKTADKDKDGLVSGGDIMKIFLTSKLPKDVLAHVWNLVDLDDSGEINSEQFALAMHFIAQKVKGSEIPKKLTANMVPPSLRSKFAGGSADDGSAGAVGGGGNEAELREAQKTNSQLKDEIKATESEIKVETEDLSSMTAEIKELRADEKRLRAELKAGKDKLVEVLAQKRKAKADKKKIEGKISTLTASKSKVEAGLKSTGYYDTTAGTEPEPDRTQWRRTG
jgi:epidermal growth factor receptor substrate 15